MRKTTALISSALFAALTAAGAFLRIPTPVGAVTLQFLFAAMSGILLGRRWAPVSQAVYVLLGLAGLPIFTTGGGLQALLQPTGGFLVGLIPMAWCIGLMTGKQPLTFGRACRACAVGLLVLYAIGLPWMHLVLTVLLHRSWSVGQTFLWGMLVYLPWDLGKILLSAWLCPRLRAALVRP